ncbi:MAG: transcription antitermination factor NusB [Simkaniaceae bacterium]|nr:transcription antitermination factor NusB [Candidatus Sacchlamyda saccharinae]
MAQSLKKFREIVFQLLYSRSFEQEDGELTLVMRQNAIPKKLAKQAEEQAKAILAKAEELDQKISEKAVDYDLQRISWIERSILRLGLFELLHTDLPDKVAIAEGIRIARKYATAEAAGFVNALLDAVYNETISKESISC